MIVDYYTRWQVMPLFGQETIQMQTIVSLVSAGLGIALAPASLRHLQGTGVVYGELNGSVPTIEKGGVFHGNKRNTQRHRPETLSHHHGDFHLTITGSQPMIIRFSHRIPRQADTLVLPPKIENLLAGLWDSGSIMLVAVPFGIITGATSVDSGLSSTMAMAMSLGVFAGASQLVALQMMAADHLPTVVVFTALLINLRLAIYSAAIAPYFHALSGFWKWPLAYLLTDQAFVVSIHRFEKNPQGLHRHWYYLRAALGLWMVWQLTTACGALLGARILEDWPLDFAVAMIFLALLMPAIRDRATVAAALTAGLTAVLGTALPHGVGLALAALVGIAVGLWTEIQTERT